LSHAPNIVASAFLFRTFLEARRDDALATRFAADALLSLTEEHGIKTFAEMGQMFAAWANGRLVDRDAGAKELAQALAAYGARGNKILVPWAHGLLAELEAATRGPDSSLAVIDHGLAIAEETGERWSDPYLLRLRGDIFLKRDPADPASVEKAYRAAIAIAKQQGAHSYELLASLSLAKLYQSTARPDEAYAVLAPALEGFTPTPEMPEIAEAQALLERLAHGGDGAILAKDPATEG
jgi:predicted ATPase